MADSSKMLNDDGSTSNERPTSIMKEFFEMDSYLADKRFTYKWSIENFSYINQQTGIPIVSQEFGATRTAMWTLQLFPNGIRSANSLNIGLYLCAKSLCVAKQVRFKLCFKDKNGRECFAKVMQANFQNENDTHGCPSMASRDELLGNEELLFKDVLTVYCELIVPQIPIHADARPIDEEEASYNLSEIFNPISLSKSLGNIYKDGNFSDVTLKTSERKFPVHKVVLAAHSSTFDEMFKNNQLREVEITGNQAESVLEEFLEFLYTGKMENLSTEKAINLLHLALKYKVKTLKRICVTFLSNNITFKNFYEIAALATTYKELNLKASVNTFFAIKGDVMVLTSKWESFTHERPDITEELKKNYLI